MDYAYKPTPRRRSYERFMVNNWATLVDKEAEQKVLLKDLSCRGVGLVSNSALEPNKKVGISLNPPIFDNPVYKEARVIWCNKVNDKVWRAGLDFGLDNLLELNSLIPHLRQLTP